MARQISEACDVVIIGGGPAGMTAAIYAARQALCTLVISPDLGGRGALAWQVENYTGYQQISGLELMRKFEEHMNQFDVRYWPEKVTGVTPMNGDYLVKTNGGREVRAGAVIIASGRKARELDVPGADKLQGHGVSYCATCDGPLYRGQDVAVIGGGNAAIYAAMQLSDLARKVTVVSDLRLSGDREAINCLKAKPNVEIKEHYHVREIKGQDMVNAMDIGPSSNHHVTEIPVQGVFVEIGSDPASDFARGLVDVDKRGQIKVDRLGHTNKPGIFAAGDVTDTPEKQIIISAGEGARAMLSAYRYLSSRKKADQWRQEAA